MPTDRDNNIKKKERKYYPSKQEPPEKTTVQNKKTNVRQRGRRRRRKRGNLVIILIMVCLIIGVFGILTYNLVKKDGVNIFVADNSVCVIKKSKTTLDDLKNAVIAQLESQTNTKIQLEAELKSEPIHISRKIQALTEDNAVIAIRDVMPYTVQSAIINVNGEDIAFLATQQEAESILKRIQSPYLPESEEEAANTEAGFVEDVKINSSFVAPEQIMDSETVFQLLTKGIENIEDYTVVKNDNISKIASKNNMTIDEFLQLNQGLTINTSINIGQTFKVKVKKSYLSVRTVETRIVKETKEKSTEIQEDDTKSRSYKKVIQEGKDGQTETEIKTIKINGEFQEEQKGETKVVVEPVTEIILQGTQ